MSTPIKQPPIEKLRISFKDMGKSFVSAFGALKAIPKMAKIFEEIKEQEIEKQIYKP